MTAVPVFLLTDFGLQDTYVGQMKAVLLARAPGCLPVDLGHGVPPQDVAAGRRALAEAWPHLPESCVVLAVVDPGVGTARRPLAVRLGSRIAVGPDNGLLTDLVGAAGAAVVALDPDAMGLSSPSSTFHGRDLFAPAAALAASGTPIEALGSPLEDPVRLPSEPAPERTGDGWRGRVVAVDRFGNLITDLRSHHVDGPVAVEIPGGRPVPVVETYADAEAGALVALIGSNGKLEIAVNGGSAAVETGLTVGAWVRIREARTLEPGA